MKYLVLSSIWAGYCFIHSYLISIRATSYLLRILKNFYSFYRFFYVLFSIASLIWVINFTSGFNNVILFTYAWPWSIIRYFLMYGSLLIFSWAFFLNYDPLSFFGIRQIINMRNGKVNTDSSQIKKSGLLGLIRHPMYLALIIYLWCQAFRIADIVVNSVLTVYVIIGTLLEEKILILESGESYRKYQKEVPMIIPFTKLGISRKQSA